MVVSSLPPPPPPPRRLRRGLRSFSCNEDLWRRIESRALVCDGARVVVDRERVVIGRSAKEAQLVLRHQAVSRQHAIVERLGAAFVVVDMASTNGVVVNGRKATRAVVGPRDVLSIGPFTIAVERA